MVTLETLSILITSVGMIIALSYYTLTIRNQNKTRQAQLMMQLWNTWDSRLRDQFNNWMRLEYDDFNDFIEKYGLESNSDFLRNNAGVVSWFENIGVLVKAGMLDIRMMALMYAGVTRMMWEKIGPLLGPWREHVNSPRLYSETEYLCKTLIKYMDEHPELRT